MWDACFKVFSRSARLGALDFLLLAPLVAQSTHREIVYQHVIVHDRVFEGLVISKDGRKPEIYDPYWGLDGSHIERNKRQGAIPFEYVFRIRSKGPLGSGVVEDEIRLDEIPAPDSPDALGILGPLWLAGFDPERRYVWLFRFSYEEHQTNSIYYDLFIRDLKHKKFLKIYAQVNKGPIPADLPSSDEDYDNYYAPPKSQLSPSGKYLAVLVRTDDSDQQLQKHLEIYRVDGEHVTLQDQESQEVRGLTHASRAGISSFHWNPGDQLECAFTPLTSPISSQAVASQKKMTTSDKSTFKTYVYADTLFSQ